jgi:Predicted hydrolases or acyltransferases (alpha/beta hydrolase superfamily)
MVAPIESNVPRHDIPIAGRSGFVLVDDRQVHYLEWGHSAAPPVVCLHGGGQTAYMWEELGAVLGTTHHVLAPDLPFHGDSDAAGDLSRESLGATIPALLEEFGFERAVFIGASLGGLVSMTVTAAHPELVRAIVLVDIATRLEDKGVERIMEFMRAHESFADLEEAAQAIGEYLPQRKKSDPSRLTRNLRQRADGRWEWKHGYTRQLRDGGEMTASGGWRQLVGGLADDVRTFTCPVLVLRGAASDVLSSEGADEIVALIPDARLATIAAAGHHAAGDNPESTVGLVTSFLREIDW